MEGENDSVYSIEKGKIHNIFLDHKTDLNQSIERLSHELLNACFSFEIRHSKLKL